MIENFKNDDEEGRLRALQRYGVLDTDREPAFDAVINLVQQIFQVPICAVSLIDRDRQWFKASYGVDVSETPRDVSFCTHAIKKDQPLMVTDATKDPVFAEHPLVVGDPRIRSYLGIPLITVDGYGVGSLCVVDVEPRTYTAEQVETLSGFAKIIVKELQLRRRGAKDPLTSTLTRSTWEDAAAAEVRRSARYGNPLSLAIFDLDCFRGVNDAYGYAAGDEVIRRFAASRLGQIRDTDTLGRFGGEEFVLLLPETSCLQALSIVERMRLAASETPIHLENGVDLMVTVSAGVTTLRSKQSVNELLRGADQALYDAKRAGRNCTMVDSLVP